MDRRKFFGAVAGLTGTAIFPRKSESAQSEGLSHEQMAEVILNHPQSVVLQGDANDFGKSRAYSPAWPDRAPGEWHTAMLSYRIDPDYTHEPHRKQKSAVRGCVIEVYVYNLPYYRLSEECLFDISNPALKMIRLLDTPNRYCARLKERWVEL